MAKVVLPMNSVISNNTGRSSSSSITCDCSSSLSNKEEGKVTIFNNNNKKQHHKQNNKESYTSKRSSTSSSCCSISGTTFRHRDRPADMNDINNKDLTTTIIDETKINEKKNFDQEQYQEISDHSEDSVSTQQQSSSSSSYTCSSSESHEHDPYVQDATTVLGIVTFEDVLNKLIKTNIKEEK